MKLRIPNSFLGAGRRCPLHAFASLAVVAGTLSCVTETTKEDPSRPWFLEFSAEHNLVQCGVYHSATFMLECDRTESSRQLYLPDIQVDPKDGAEVIRICGCHEIRFRLGRFHVAHATYTPERGSILYVFKERQGDFAFRFHTQPLVIEAAGRWVPSLLYSTESVSDARSGLVWPKETLRIGSTTIQTDSRSGEWLVDGKPFQPDPSSVLTIRGTVPAAIHARPSATR
jgi:hypothetical protein